MGNFLNVDLDLDTGFDAGDLVRELAGSMLVLHETQGRAATFELDANPTSVLEAMRGMDAILQRLTPQGLLQWRQCRKRSFNVGFEAALPMVVEIPEEAVAIAASHGGEILVTVYPVDRPPGDKAR